MEEKSHSPRIGGSWEWEEARKQIPRSFQKPHGTADTTILGQRRPAGASGLQNQEDYKFILFEVSMEDTPAQGGSLWLCCPHPYRETSRASFVRAQLSLLGLNWKWRQKLGNCQLLIRSRQGLLFTFLDLPGRFLWLAFFAPGWSPRTLVSLPGLVTADCRSKFYNPSWCCFPFEAAGQRTALEWKVSRPLVCVSSDH